MGGGGGREGDYYLEMESNFWELMLFTNLNFIRTRFLLYSSQWLPQQEVLEESARIFIYQTEQSYVKQTWHL